MSSHCASPPLQPPPVVGWLIEQAEECLRQGQVRLGRARLAEAVAADPTPAARITLALALAREHPREALIELQQAWDQARRLDSPSFRALCCRNLAVLHQRLGHPDLSVRYQQHALTAEMDAVDADAGLSPQALIDLAVHWSTTSDVTWTESLLRAAETRDPDLAERAAIASCRGGIAAWRGRCEDALVHWSRAQREFRDADEPAGVAHTLLNLGHLLQSEGRLRLARRAFVLARDQFLEQRHLEQAGSAHAFALEASACERLRESEPAWN